MTKLLSPGLSTDVVWALRLGHSTQSQTCPKAAPASSWLGFASSLCCTVWTATQGAQVPAGGGSFQEALSACLHPSSPHFWLVSVIGRVRDGRPATRFFISGLWLLERVLGHIPTEAFFLIYSLIATVTLHSCIPLPFSGPQRETSFFLKENLIFFQRAPCFHMVFCLHEWSIKQFLS